MEYHLTKLPKSEIEIEVIIPFSEFEPHTKRAAVLLSEEVEIEGFRKGKAPYEIIKQKVGEAALYEKAAELAVQKTYPEILKEAMQHDPNFLDHPPVGKPEIIITKLAPGNEFRYKGKFASLPYVTLPDYASVAKNVLREKKEVSVRDEEIDRAILWLQEGRVKTERVLRPAAHGDAVHIDFTISDAANGIVLEHGVSKNHPLVIGKEKFIPGFEAELIGMKAGEEKKFSVLVPETWHEKNIAGKTLECVVFMREVEERKIPDCDDTFAQSLGNFSSVLELKKSVHEGLIREKQEKENERVRMRIIEGIAKDSVIDLPDILVESELEKMLLELQEGVAGMRMKWEEYLLHIHKTLDDLKREWREEAIKRVRFALVLREIARREHIDSAKEEVEAKANEYLQKYQSLEETKKSIDPEALREYTRGIVRNQKVFEFLENV